MTPDFTPLLVIVPYLMLLLGVGLVSALLFRGTSSDFFVASRSIGPFLLLMSVFGTTMTAFALIGSSGKAYDHGIGVYGLMASSSGLIHSLVFFMVGIKLWAIGKRYGYVTQIQYFRARFESHGLGYLLFPVLVGLVVPYLLMGLIGSGAVVAGVTKGGVHPNLTSAVICGVVLCYVFFGGLRGAAWANAFQTIVFMITGIVAFVLIANAMGGMQAASEQVAANAPEHLSREGLIGPKQFLTYMLVPLSVGMFPHLFQHWLTAKSAKTFRLTVIAHPLFIMIVWVPCILIGIWAFASPDVTLPPGKGANSILGVTVGQLLKNPWLSGLLTAGILAAIMSSLDSQFVCLGTMFTNDVALPLLKDREITDRQKIWMGRGFIAFIVLVTYGLSLLKPPNIFDLGVWCFSGFASLFPIVFAAIYWRRVTKAGAIAAVLVTAVVWYIMFHQDVVAGDPDREGDYLVWGMMPVAFTFLASLVTLVVVSLITSPPSDETVEKFIPPR
jgi:SSS family solute:Na+ symporter